MLFFSSENNSLGKFDCHVDPFPFVDRKIALWSKYNWSFNLQSNWLQSPRSSNCWYENILLLVSSLKWRQAAKNVSIGSIKKCIWANKFGNGRTEQMQYLHKTAFKRPVLLICTGVETASLFSELQWCELYSSVLFPLADSPLLVVALLWIQWMTSHLIAWEVLAWCTSTRWWVILGREAQIDGFVLIYVWDGKACLFIFPTCVHRERKNTRSLRSVETLVQSRWWWRDPTNTPSHRSKMPWGMVYGQLRMPLKMVRKRRTKQFSFSSSDCIS